MDIAYVHTCTVLINPGNLSSRVMCNEYNRRYDVQSLINASYLLRPCSWFVAMAENRPLEVSFIKSDMAKIDAAFGVPSRYNDQSSTPECTD